jgi:RNA polymerase sigma-70 factor (ECF subfamily)
MLALRVEKSCDCRYGAPASLKPRPVSRATMTEVEDDKTFFSRNVEENLDAFYGVALRLTRKRTDAEDLVAEAIARAWTALDTLEDRLRFRPWLFRILRNCFISEYRRKAVRPVETTYDEADSDDSDVSSFLMEESDDFLRWWASPEQAFFNSVLAEDIAAAINELPESFRVTIQLVNVEGLTYDEAAEALGVPKGTVRSRMKRGRTLLQRALWAHAQDAGLTSSGTETDE